DRRSASFPGRTLRHLRPLSTAVHRCVQQANRRALPSGRGCQAFDRGAGKVSELVRVGKVTCLAKVRKITNPHHKETIHDSASATAQTLPVAQRFATEGPISFGCERLQLKSMSFPEQALISE